MNPTTDQLDAIQELVTVGIGRAASALSDMVLQRVELSVPRLRPLRAEDAAQLIEDGQGPLAVVEQPFFGKLFGSAMLIVPEASAASLVNLLTGGQLDPDEMAAEQAAVLTEAGNILINGVVGSLANQVGEGVDFELPSFRACDADELRVNLFGRGKQLILVEVQFSIAAHHVRGSMGLVFDVEAMEFLLCSVQHMLEGGG